MSKTTNFSHFFPVSCGFWTSQSTKILYWTSNAYEHLPTSTLITPLYNMPIFINIPSLSVQRSVLRCSPLVRKILSELSSYNLLQQIERSTVSTEVDKYGYNWLGMTRTYVFNRFISKFGQFSRLMAFS